MSITLVGKHEPSKINNCEGFVEAMLDMMKTDSRIVYLDADLAECIHGEAIKAAYPQRMINCGIAEQNAVSVAGGMAAAGMNAFFHSFGAFAGRRCYDQAFLSAGYQRVPVHIIGSDPGITSAHNGVTHMPFEDAGLYIGIPNAIVLDPCDYAQTKSLTYAIAKEPELTYMRLIRKAHIQVYEPGSEFEIGKGVVLKEGTDVTIISSGFLLDEALKAAEALEAEGVSVELIDMFTWKPIDEALIVEAAKKTGCVVTAENHNVLTGLGAAVSSVLSRNLPVPMEMIGVQNRFGQVGTTDFLMKEYSLGAENIVAAAKKAMARK